MMKILKWFFIIIIGVSVLYLIFDNVEVKDSTSINNLNEREIGYFKGSVKKSKRNILNGLMGSNTYPFDDLSFCLETRESKELTNTIQVIFDVCIAEWDMGVLEKNSEVIKKRIQEEKKAERERNRVIQDKLHRENKIQSQFSAWNGAHIKLEGMIKKSMNDPDSYQHNETRFREKKNSIVVRTSFRGKNAFGGTVLNHVVVEFDLNGNLIQIISEGSGP